jgi:hypothetical protein
MSFQHGDLLAEQGMCPEHHCDRPQDKKLCLCEHLSKCRLKMGPSGGKASAGCGWKPEATVPKCTAYVTTW